MSLTSGSPRPPAADASDAALAALLTGAYGGILLCGLVGNLSACVVIARNRSMHTATNFYLFNLAVSDLLLLLAGLPLELHRLWVPGRYPLPAGGCTALSLAAETATNATILTVTAFTVERYIAICHPFLAHSMSKLSRAVRFIVAIWLLAAAAAVPQAMQFGIVSPGEGGETACTVQGAGMHQFFVISGFVFFVVPMSVISVLYAQIGLKLRRSSVLRPKHSSVDSARTSLPARRPYRSGASQRRVVRMLVAVTLSFFVCWAPFHVQRLLAIYGKSLDQPSDTFVMVYVVLTYLSGVLYFLSAAINPILYNIMSNKFREAFKTTLRVCCGRRGGAGARHERTYSMLLAARRQRAAAWEAGVAGGGAGAGPRRLRRLSTATSQLEAPPRAEHYHRRELVALSESSSCGGWAGGAGGGAGGGGEAGSGSISDSSLRQLEPEFTMQELASVLHELNAHPHPAHPAHPA